jgi:hypothetical protein
MRASRLILPAWALTSILAGVGSSPAPAQRATRDLQALYDFSSASGSLIKDRSGTGQPIDLRLGDAKGVGRSKGTLKIRSETLVQSHKPARRLVEAVKRFIFMSGREGHRLQRMMPSVNTRLITMSIRMPFI